MDKNEYELVYLAQEGNEDAINELYKRYKPIIVKKSKSAFFLASHHGIDINDIMQEGFIGLDEAIKSFSQNENASFYTFSMVCIERKIKNYLKKTSNGKEKILNEAVAIDESLEKVIDNGVDVEANVLDKYDNYSVLECRKLLTDFEKKVFDLKVKDYSFEEISQILKRDIKSIYNTFHRIKVKIKKNMKIDD